MGGKRVVLLVTATRFEGKWIKKFDYVGDKNFSQCIDLHYYVFNRGRTTAVNPKMYLEGLRSLISRAKGEM